MKKLSKIKLHEAAVLNDSEMKMVLGGSGGGEPSDKEKACEGKKEGDRCEWMYKGVKQGGKCISFYGKPLHCSDLN